MDVAVEYRHRSESFQVRECTCAVTSRGCSRPMSAMSPIETRGGPHIFRGPFARRRNKSRVTESIEQTMPHQTFEEVVLPHLDAAHNYARWLTKNDADALEEPS
jgi:hypothetical protein